MFDSGRLVRRGRRALFPLVERDFTYRSYDDFLAVLTQAGAAVVPLRALAGNMAPGRPIVGLRHDVDENLESALELARLEHRRGLRATYFILHSAPYWERRDLVNVLRRIQDDYGHEIGWHNDLVTWHCFGGEGGVGAYLAAGLDRLRSAGIDVVGSASHGSPLCHRYGYHNNYVFAEFADEIVAGFPNNKAVGGRRIPRLRFADFGFEYEAYHLPYDLYFSDTATASGARWHPKTLDRAVLQRGRRVVFLIHPEHWDASVPAKVARLARLVAAARWRDPARAVPV